MRISAPEIVILDKLLDLILELRSFTKIVFKLKTRPTESLTHSKSNSTLPPLCFLKTVLKRSTLNKLISSFLTKNWVLKKKRTIKHIAWMSDRKLIWTFILYCGCKEPVPLRTSDCPLEHNEPTQCNIKLFRAEVLVQGSLVRMQFVCIYSFLQSVNKKRLLTWKRPRGFASLQEVLMARGLSPFATHTHACAQTTHTEWQCYALSGTPGQCCMYYVREEKWSVNPGGAFS